MPPIKITSSLATAAVLLLPGCATFLDSMTSLDETTASQRVLLEKMEVALVSASGSSLPDQLARTEDAVVRLAGGETDGRSLADLAGSLNQTNMAIGRMSSTLEGVLDTTRSLVWPQGEVPPGETEGGSILAGVYRSTARIAGILPDRPTLMLLAGVAIGALIAMVFGRRRPAR